MKFSDFNNKKLGTSFEESLSDYLSYKGFWIQPVTPNQDGQSADILAIKGGQAYLIDAKVCSNGIFDIQRIEENQESSMKKFKDCGNETGLFALWIDKQVIVICSIDDLKQLAQAKQKRYLNSSDIESISIPLEEWADEVRL